MKLDLKRQCTFADDAFALLGNGNKATAVIPMLCSINEARTLPRSLLHTRHLPTEVIELPRDIPVTLSITR